MVLKNTNVKVATRQSPLTGEDGGLYCAVLCAGLDWIGLGWVVFGCAPLCSVGFVCLFVCCVLCWVGLCRVVVVCFVRRGSGLCCGVLLFVFCVVL